MERLKQHGLYWYEKKIWAKKKGDKFGYRQPKSMLNDVVGFLGVDPDNYKGEGMTYSTQSNVASASFINAYARVQLARTINTIGLDHYLYGDTDSIHILLPKSCLTKGTYDERKTLQWLKSKDIEVDEYKLGAWKIERVFKKAKVIIARQYIEQDINGEWKSVVSGYKKQIPSDQFELGHNLYQHKARRVDGGTLLMEECFRLGHF